MGYHGVLSKGCQRCRRRKVKCDQSKPACRRCEKLGVPCSGYRDLLEAQFIDESPRVVRKATARAGPPDQAPMDVGCSKAITPGPESAASDHASTAVRLQIEDWFRLFPNSEAGLRYPSLGGPMNVLCANFFLAHYAPTAPVLSDHSYDWLIQAYWDTGNDLVRLATDAVSFAALSNKFFAPDMKPRSRQLYGQALARLNTMLEDPVQAVRDDTLMCVVLLGLYERVNLMSWDDYRRWSAHMEGAAMLLKLRGTEQFSRAAGRQLYIHLRSQIIHNCMMQHTAVPDSLKDTSNFFQPSDHWPVTYDTRPGSLGQISFQIVNLRAAVSARTLTDPEEILEAALGAERTLERWTLHAPQGWSHGSFTPSAADMIQPGDGIQEENAATSMSEHTYANVGVAQVWNNWRALRIIAHQIVIYHGPSPLRADCATSAEADERYAQLEEHSAYIIRQMSTDVLAAAPAVSDTPRAGSLVWPLFLIAQEPLNPVHVRNQAVRVLRQVNNTLGYRIASLMADTAEETFIGDMIGGLPVPHTPFQALLLSG
ncbi:uncharacterized protein B0I36DRAFT_69394 [Microdochium trichocladiopsis]|uniref:Zn(2)-C6 fungal-type domain-containing protein n=1 Tax=Microdochium trichocladiopsis TaxID=1682393 RepID=A0A9P9BUI2_9PEZI|nr:uncharacterized protein B0I36DRAFT_69394 [Microdochium trichocladiopsis]KAH7037661.1 hypothetical protein B0I36DRAFT_69394 [Microdochium trichocladiopsis]